MTLVLHRIDDRLIHGQVVVGWGQPLNIQFIVLVDDAVAASEWSRSCIGWEFLRRWMCTS